MRSGYLTTETIAELPGMVRFHLSDTMPNMESNDGAGKRVWHVARFSDSEAALMHAHEILKRRLVDLDSHLYRATPEQAIAAVESIGLSERRVYLDPNLSDQQRADIERLTQRKLRQRRHKERFFEVLGYIGLLLLLFNLFFISLP